MKEEGGRVIYHLNQPTSEFHQTGLHLVLRQLLLVVVVGGGVVRLAVGGGWAGALN
jgi:hypothetical protein